MYGASESTDVTTDALESKLLWKSEFFRLYPTLLFFFPVDDSV
jgi:hypothetical protein